MHRSLILVAVVAMALTLLAPHRSRRETAGGARGRLAGQHGPGRARRLRGERGCPPGDLDPVEHLGRPRWQYRCFKGRGTCVFPGALARGLRDRGVTPLIYWQPTNPADPGAGRFERYRNIIAGKHDRYIREWARAAKAFGRPVIVRLAHEMNGTWFPWSLTNFDNTARASGRPGVTS